MIFEISGSYELILPLLLAAVIATLGADLLHPESYYQLQLSRRGLSLLRLREIDLLQTVRVGEVMDRDVPTVFAEETLRDFGDLVTEITADRPVLVLVDELESITEPGAAATIIAGILESLTEREAAGVFVSHLAEDIVAAAEADLSVDGIRAEGLVDGELRVNRSPVKGELARSTPELIVEKLAEDGDGFYAGLLEKFE